MILVDFLRAVGQLGDPRFRRVLLIGVALTLALLVGVYAAFLGLVGWLTPEAVTIPFVGEVEGLGTLLTGASLLFMLGLSIFLMVPVASAFTSLFLDDVTDAVEARHYPGLPPVDRVSLVEGLADSAGYFAVLVAVNAGALFVYPLAGPATPAVFWAVNGFLLGREYFQLVAMRRLGRQGARDMRRRHPLAIWGAGTLMAVPLSVPVVNFLVPVLGAATFTHLFHRLQAAEHPSSRNRGPR